MYMIVVLHFVAHNLLNKDNPAVLGDKNFLSANAILAVTECAVDCFVLISGYFGIKLSLRKIVLFLLPIAFYEFVISSIYLPYKGGISITPFNYWFVRPYFVLMLLSPILNKGLKSLSKNSIRVIILAGVVFFFLPVISFSGNMGRNLTTFLYLYIIGYYIRNYLNTCNIYIYIFGTVASAAIVFAENFLLNYIGKGHIAYDIAYSYDNIFILSEAVFLFLTFLKINIQSRFINRIAASSFFVYIISENVNMYQSPYSMYDLLGVKAWGQSDEYVLLILTASFAVFCAAIIIDQIRKLIFGKLERLIGNKIDSLNVEFNT